MGKQKGEGGGRSKSRASSSSLAASLVQGGGVPAVGFGGYLGSSRIEPPSSSSDDSAPLPDVDSEVLQHLRRLGRKDPTTKLKALTTLSLLFAQKPGEEVVQIVPQWAFEYKKLLLDYNREVRRATHESMASLVTTVKKGLAPHLKSLMGPWWFSQFDPTPDVAQAARHSFEAAFPQSERRLDALMLCVKEIFLYLDENLKLTTQALSDKATPMDELEDMHQRIISSSLLAIATLIDILLGVKLQNYDNDSANTENKTLSKVRSATLSSAETMFSMHKYFLDFLKSKSAVVRSATYSLLTSYIKHVPHMFNEETMKTISSAILGAFQEKDASCHSSMWNMILLFSRKFPEGWSYCNIHKVVLNRFWYFLRNGCYGSKQVSYPLLVLFLESIPFKAVAGEQLVFDFLQNLWGGRNPWHLSAADSLAFCNAFKQCFLWLLENESRYSGGDSSNDISIKLVNDILAKLLWHDYLLLSLSKNQDINSKNPLDESTGDDGQLSDEKSLRAANTHYPTYYLQDLGKCIIEILAEISLTGNHLLQVVCASFEKDCLEIIQQGKHLPKFDEHVQQLVSFFLSLDQLVLQKGQTWPLDCLARPLIVESLPAMRSMDTPRLVKLLLVLVEIFGPVTIFLENSQRSDEKSKREIYLQLFNDDFIPWCLDGNNSTSSSKIDLLLSLVQDEYFFDQWCSIIKYTIMNQKHSSDTETSESINQFELLALILEKVRERLTTRKLGNFQKYGSLPEHWRYDLLDSAAISVSCSSPARLSDACFLCAALGGSVQDDQICFLSAETVVHVLGHILKSLALVLMTSTFDWARSSYASLLPTESEHLKHLEEPSLSTSYKMAQFAFKVLEGSIFCLRILDEDSMLLPSILAVLFIIEWECSMTSVGGEENDSESGKDDIDIGVSAYSGLEDYSDERVYLKVNLGERIHIFRRSLSPAFWSSLNSYTSTRLGNILVQSVRSAVFETIDLSVDRVSVLCSEWVADMLKAICLDHTQLQNLLDLLLSEGKYWPFWVKPSLHNESVSVKIQFEPVFTDDTELKHHQFVAFVDKLILSLGFSDVILGAPEIPHATASQSTEVASPISSFSRAWLAAEILYTWKWPGGSALSSFLPSLIQYMKTETYVFDGSIVSLLLDILLDGALMHGTSQWMLLNAWHLSDDEVEKIQDRFLRALVALLFTINIEDNIWRKSDAVVFFECLLSKLFIGSTVNRPCLRVLPFVMSVIIKPLFKTSELDQASSDTDLVGKNILSWLDAAISCLSSSPGELLQQDVEDWTQAVLSCFPLRVAGGVRKLGVEIERDISNMEKSLLLTLFRRYQVFYNGLSSTPSTGEITPSKTVQLMEAKLTAVIVGYCWTELEEDDWSFVFGRVRKWIESSVLLMEEMVEDVDSAVIKHKSTEDALEKLILVVDTVDLLIVSIAEAALITLCLLTHLEDLQEIEKFQNLQIRMRKYAESRDQMVGSILRLFLATGVSEAIANSCSEEASSIIASSRLDYLQFWELVASFVNNASPQIRSSAVESMELWGLSKRSVSGLYAILFSSRPISHLQFAAYSLLLSEPLCRLALVKESCLEGNDLPTRESDLGQSVELTSLETLYLRDELSTSMEMPTSELLKTDLLAQDRVNVFIAWTLLLSHLQLLPSSSTTREKLIQYIQDNISSSILDCIFQHIPLKAGAPSGKKKDAELLPEADAAAKASKHAIVTCSLLPYVESLWPIRTEQMASLAGSIYGMMIRLLPSYVRTWFTSLRDRSLSYSIESFTRAWCSPPLLLDEFSQVKDTVYADDNFSVSVNRSAYEIVATYKKEETGMDLVIRLPNSYPLRHVDVECTRSLGISEVKQRKWLLSLTAFVRNQNGAIAEAIRTWKSNFDKEFEGVEECPICYSILHTSNHSLPRLACKTCRHKFHAACLYKWFSTSNKSTCPLCQTPF